MGRFRSITHPFAARQHVLLHLLPLDLHVLGTPPAFNLSQDQTLQFDLNQNLPAQRIEVNSLLFRAFEVSTKTFSDFRTLSLKRPRLSAVDF